jgi:hypothetical protein
MAQRVLLGSLLALATLSACTSAPPAPQAASVPASPPPASAEPSVQGLPTSTVSSPPVLDIRPRCAAEIRRQLACVDDFVGTIVAVRVKLDLPPGMAEKGKDPAGRAALVATAKQEFLVDYAPDRITAICEKRQAQVAAMPPEVLNELQKTDNDCTAVGDCALFARCMAPQLEAALRRGLSSGAK